MFEEGLRTKIKLDVFIQFGIYKSIEFKIIFT